MSCFWADHSSSQACPVRMSVLVSGGRHKQLGMVIMPYAGFGPVRVQNRLIWAGTIGLEHAKSARAEAICRRRRLGARPLCSLGVASVFHALLAVSQTARLGALRGQISAPSRAWPAPGGAVARSRMRQVAPRRAAPAP